MLLLPWFRRPLLIGAGALGSLALGLALLDQAATGLVSFWSPALERNLSGLLGQPVQLGPLQRLLPWGLELGPSRITPGGLNRSSLSLGGLQATLAPLASLRQGALVLQLRPQQVQAVLRPNRNGRYWDLMPLRPGRQPPRLALQLQLHEPAAVTLEPNRSRWALRGDLQLQLQRRQLDLRAVLRPQRAPAQTSLQLRSQAAWARRRWDVRLDARQLPAADLLSLLPLQVPRRPPGQLSGSVSLRWRQGQPDCHGQVVLQQALWQGSDGLQRAQLRCQGQTLSLAPTTLRLGRWQAGLSARARWGGGRQLQLEAFELRHGDSWIRGKGKLANGPALQSHWRLRLADLPDAQRLPAWLRPTLMQGQLLSDGSWKHPRLRVPDLRGSDRLLGAWQAALQWTPGLVTLQQLRGQQLQASGTLPLPHGPLRLQLELNNVPLKRLQPLLHTRLAGVLQARGTVEGPWQRWRSDLDLAISNPGAGPLRLAERWQGRWQGPSGGGGVLRLTSLAPAPLGQLEVSLDRRWRLGQIQLTRGEGRFSLSRSRTAFSWSSDALPLDGLDLVRANGVLPLRGLLSGSGSLDLRPLALDGTARVERPAIPGLQLQQIRLQGHYGGSADGPYSVKASLQPLGQGNIEAQARGRVRGPFALGLQARSLAGTTLRQLADLWPQWQGRTAGGRGRALDLGELMLITLGDSLQQQLQALNRAQAAVQQADGGARQGSLTQRLRQLQALVDADVSLSGPDLRRSRLDLAAKGHLWLGEDTADRALSDAPVVVRLQGPLQQGSGDLSLQQLPLALLALLTPVPEGLRGSLGITGRYGLGRRQPELNLNLSLQQAGLGEQNLTLPRGSVQLVDQALRLDLALLASGASSSIDLSGILPLDPDSSRLELRLASRGDGLRFLTTLAGPDLNWQKGSADLQLLLRGSLNDPIANGFLRIRDGRLRVIQQTVDDLQATVVFDFEQLLVQELTARVGERGRITAQGHLGLLQPTDSQPPLTVELSRVPFALPRIAAVAGGQLQLSGSLRAMTMGGDLAIDQGSINAQRGRLVSTRPGPAAQTPRKSVTQLLQENWDFESPLLLVGAEVETNTSQRVLEAVPRFAALGFDDLRLKLGPNLRIVIPNAASFQTAGLLRLSGRLDPTLRARGVVRLLQGRLNLFTTSFSLDPEANNVAIFTPALGLIPYLDIAMRTRVSDSLAVAGLAPTGSRSVAELGSQASFNALNQFNLVLITVSVSGPADRLAQTLRLRSSPPLPESRLIALIGGNSLAGLSGSGAGTAIATVVGQTLLSPVLGGLSDALGQRVSFALYPTYVTPNVNNTAVLQSRRQAPQLVLGSEIGLDVSERFNVSVLAAPNRSDVPPQVNINLRASDLLNLQGAVNSQGAWQTQLQLFVRF